LAEFQATYALQSRSQGLVQWKTRVDFLLLTSPSAYLRTSVEATRPTKPPSLTTGAQPMFFPSSKEGLFGQIPVSSSFSERTFAIGNMVFSQFQEYVILNTSQAGINVRKLDHWFMACWLEDAVYSFEIRGEGKQWQTKRIDLAKP
jgi:hypothetical protein